MNPRRKRPDRESCGRLGGGAQDHPVHIRAEVFTANGAIGGALDGRAAFSGDGANAVAPLAYEDRANPEFFCKGGSRSV